MAKLDTSSEIIPDNTCPKCGSANRNTARFCQRCSAALITSYSPTEIEALQAELARRHRNLAILKEQQSVYGIDVPLRLVNQIADEERRIAEIEARLSGIKDEPSLAAQYFSRATQALVIGDLWEARRYYEMTLSEDPFYPHASKQLALVKRQLVQAYPPPYEAPAIPIEMIKEMKKEIARKRSAFSVISCLIVISLLILLLAAIGYLFVSGTWPF